MTFSTFSEQRFFAHPKKNSIKGVVVNANMVAYAPDGLAAFLMERTANSTYLIDPQTHAFQHDPAAIRNKEDQVKGSILLLSQQLGEPVASCVNNGRPLRPADFSDDTLLKDFVGRCLTFQRTALSVAMAQCDANKYIAQTQQQLEPYRLLSPYFYMTESTAREWLPVCLRLAHAAANAKQHNKLYVPLVIDKAALVHPKIPQFIASRFKDVNCDGFTIWIDGLNEHESSTTHLKALSDLALELRADGKREVLNLHGGYFSILAGSTLGKNAFSGVAHGPEFGEFRAVVPVGGGIPIARYYVPQLHARIRYREAADMFRRKGWLNTAAVFHQNVCQCDTCKSVIDGNPSNFVKFGASNAKLVKRGKGYVRMDFPTTTTKENCLCHYLERKHREYADSVANDDQLIADLEKGIADYEGMFGSETVEHLHTWKRVFRPEPGLGL